MISLKMLRELAEKANHVALVIGLDKGEERSICILSPDTILKLIEVIEIQQAALKKYDQWDREWGQQPNLAKEALAKAEAILEGRE